MMSHGGQERGRPAGVVLAAVVLSLCVAQASLAEIDLEQTRLDMREIYASLEILLPLSADADAFASPKERDRIRRALSTIALRAGHVASHAAKGDRRVQFLGDSLALETQEAIRRFDAGSFEGAQFYVRRLTDFCVACHSRVPSPADSPLSRDFVSAEQLAKLPPERRAALQIATRRFDYALTSFESLFASAATHPSELLEPLTQYLIVAIRVKNDLSRPVPVLRKFAARPDLWGGLRSDVARWVETLERYASQSGTKPSLKTARVLLDDASQLVRFPTDRQALVHYLIASAHLHRFIEAHSGESSRDVAEAYYLLGLIESRANVSSWVYSEADFYLETAIRMAPKERVAEQAFELLEEETVLGWSGSEGERMPKEVRDNLDELRALVHPE